MIKGKLNITKTKKGFDVKILFEKKGKQKQVSVPYSNITDENLNGKDIEFDQVEGMITKITYEGKVVFNRDLQKKQYPEQFKSKKSETGTIQKKFLDLKRQAKAPYNFVPLNEKFVSAGKIPTLNKYVKDRNTGWIKLNVRTITPIYIRDTLNNEELEQERKIEKENKKRKQNKEKFINANFFSPNSKPAIPGSSLRGMIRNLVEIVSYGRFGFFDDARLYYRGVAGGCKPLRDDYQAKIGYCDKQTGDPHYKVTAGIIKKDENKYYIYSSSGYSQISRQNAESKLKTINERFKNFCYYTMPDKSFIVIPGDMQRRNKPWLIQAPNMDIDKRIEISDEDIREYNNDALRGKNVYNLIDEADSKKTPPCFFIQWQDFKNNNRIAFGHTVNFRLAYNKTIGDHIPKKLKIKECVISNECIQQIESSHFFANLKEEDQVIVIQTLHLLINKKWTYEDLKVELLKKFDKKKNKRELTNAILKHSTMFDFAEAVFGNETLFAGRVFFEDALIDENEEHTALPESIPQILASPKPTTFQHYLEQDHNDINKLYTYNKEDTNIRGNKLFWHKSGEQWKERIVVYNKDNFWKMIEEFNEEFNIKATDFENAIIKRKDEDIHTLMQIRIDLDRVVPQMKTYVLKSIGNFERQHTKMKPLEAEQFSGKIRFENLSDVELGVLLFSLDLPEGCCHKLGMGKPLGLGSIKIKPELFLSNRAKVEEENSRYKKLFSEWGNKPEKPEEIAGYKKAFENYVLKQIGETDKKELWDTKRLQELKLMLNFEKGKELEEHGKINYMEMSSNEFKNRPILPKPSKV